MIHYYHPNRAVKGFACSVWYSSRDKSIYARLVKQSDWNNETQNGVFKGSLNDPNKNVTIKLEFVEAAAILDCIDNGRPFSAFHQDNEKTKGIKFEPWIMNDIQKGYSFSIIVSNKQDTTQKNSYYIGLTFAEARLLYEALRFAIHQDFQNFSDPRPRKNISDF